MTRIVVVEMGVPGEIFLRNHGSYGSWFCNAIRKVAPDLTVATLPVETADADTMRQGIGVILSGAEEGVYDDLPWRQSFEGEIVRVIEDGFPLLGVCFAHQYLTELFGGKVERSSSGKEFGRYLINITADGEEDPLFAGIKNPFGALESHNDVVVRPAPGAVRLASSEKVAWQAFRWSENVRGVQFHPEMTPEIAISILAKELTDSRDSVEHSGRINDLKKPHAGLDVLSNFLNICLAW
ncbi:MAG TPA: hypothetical protein VMX35_10665 [Acidobacteriota bacterium]|nr:hypothetical protein [Acidobacteriota bacterium]